MTCTLTGLERPSGGGAAPKNQLLTATESSMTRCINYRVENSKSCRKLPLVMLDWLGAPTWHFARSILNTTPGYSNSGSMRPDFEIDGSGGIRARRRPGGDTESLPRCNEAARRTQRRRLVRLASAQRPLGGWQSRAAGWSRGRRVLHLTLRQCFWCFSSVFAARIQS